MVKKNDEVVGQYGEASRKDSGERVICANNTTYELIILSLYISASINIPSKDRH